MKVVNSINELRNELGEGAVGLVPTMGALHEGHLRLAKLSVSENETTIVSIYVNPTQFGQNEDFNKYPRTLESDLEKCATAGVNIVFCPDVDEIKGEDLLEIKIRKITDQFEGAIRPGHFEGVATIVAQLLLIMMPNRAYFGLKDLQQCAVIRTLVSSLFMPIELKFVETVRESNGLAMSSRNRYLSEEQRKTAAQLHQTIEEIANLSKEGKLETLADWNLVREHSLSRLKISGFKLDYLEIVNPWEMVQSLKNSERRVIIAAKLDQVRLIDNISVF